MTRGSARQRREGAARRRRDFSARSSELQDDFNARRNEELSRLQRTLVEEVRTYAKAQSFDLILAEGVMYATTALDITAGGAGGAAGARRAAGRAPPAAPAPAKPPAK